MFSIACSYLNERSFVVLITQDPCYHLSLIRGVLNLTHLSGIIVQGTRYYNHGYTLDVLV